MYGDNAAMDYCHMHLYGAYRAYYYRSIVDYFCHLQMIFFQDFPCFLFVEKEGKIITILSLCLPTGRIIELWSATDKHNCPVNGTHDFMLNNRNSDGQAS